MKIAVSIASLAALLACATPAFAQDGTALEAPPAAERLFLKDGTLYARLLNTPLFVIGQPERHRPPALPWLYMSFIGLEIMDGSSTSRGLARGAVESNPLVRLAVEHPASLWAVKGGAAVASIFAAERLWKRHHRSQAITLMVVSNAVMGVVAARNVSAINKTAQD